jgi:hypothetical protein
LAKNKIQWLKNDIYNSEDELDENYHSAQSRQEVEIQLNDLNREGIMLDEMINNIKSKFEKLSDGNDFKEYGYVTFEDIKSLTNGENINLIAIKAPPGTSLEVPDHEQLNNIYLQTKQVIYFT